MSGDMGNTHVHPATPSSSQIGGSGGRKKERRVEFAAETLNMWKQHNINNNPKASSSSLQFYHQQHLPSLLRLSQYPPGSHNSGNNSLVLNDMGPPLSRSLLLERAGVAIGVGGVGEHDGVGLGPNSTGTISRAGSVRSYGSQATSDVVHVDTDDCGGSLIESEGKCSRVSSVEETSVHHLSSLASPVLGNRQHDYSEAVDVDGGGGCSEECQDDDGDTNNNKNNNNNNGSSSIPSNTTNNLLCDRRLSGPHSSGRTSPGGTVYKGRGVRRYKGRYFHLPLKRFHQNGVTVALAHSHLHEDDDTAGCCGDGGGGGSIDDEDNVFGGGVGGSLSDHMNTHEGGGEGISPAEDFAQHAGGQQHHRERWTQRRSWSRSRSRERTGDRGVSGGGRKRSRGQSQSESPALPSSSRCSNYNNNRSPSVSREFRGGNNNWNGGGGRWRHNHRGWNGCSNGGGGSSGNNGEGNNKWGDGSTPRQRNNNNSRGGGGGGGGYHQGGRQSQGMTPRDARHHRDRRR